MSTPVLEVRGLAAPAMPPTEQVPVPGPAQPPVPPQQATRAKQIPNLPVLAFTSGQLAGSEQGVGQQIVERIGAQGPDASVHFVVERELALLVIARDEPQPLSGPISAAETWKHSERPTELRR